MARVTIMLDDTTYKKVVGYQAKKIITTNGAYSFSKCVNELLGVALK